MSTEYEYKLSVVVLVYNAEYYLKDCLESLVNQTLDGIEIICVNDGSTDNSLNVLKRYAKKYDNIKIIDQENAGGANAGNKGLRMAKGEYVTLVDSDDVVVEDAYEKMYNKAKETDSDVVGGKPNIYMSGFQREVSLKHNIWTEEKCVNPDEYVEIYHDVFYWDKIYRREFAQKHDVYMIPGKLYADAPMVFRAYLYANKVTLIPDVVYYWRKRSSEAINKGDSYTSITKSLLDVNNMHDRLVTYYYLKDYFKEAGKEDKFSDLIKLYSERFFYPINGILKDEEFKKAYLDELIPILEDIDDVYNNDLNIHFNLYTYFLLNNQIDALEDFISFHLYDYETEIIDGKTYWDLKYFKNPEYNVPDELFEVNRVESKLIRIKDIHADKKYINISNIYVPGNFKIDKAYIQLVGLTKKGALEKDNRYYFELEEYKPNHFNAKIPIKSIDNINIFDTYMRFKYDGKDEVYRIQESHFDNINKNDLSTNKFVKPFFSKLGNLSILNAFAKDLFTIEADDEKIRIRQNPKGDINYRISIDYKRPSERVYFTRVMDDNDKLTNEFELKWKYSVDANIPYTLYLNINKIRYKLISDFFIDFKGKNLNYKGNTIKLFEDTDNTISLRLNKSIL